MMLNFIYRIKLINACLLLGSFVCISAKNPNIVFILTDDQDVALGGQVPMVKTRKLIGEQGMTFTNMFTSSPLCCPSRSSIFTGRYVHNHGAVNNSVSGNCSSPAWQETQESKAFPTVLKSKGYKTFFAGKYLNQYGFPRTGGVDHVPPGWDSWMGLVGNSRYYDYSLSVDGTRVKHGNQYPSDYLTEVIHKQAQKFLGDRHKWSDPFFMMLSTPACHAPFTPAPQYAQRFPNDTAPCNGSYNVKGKDKHWLLRQTIVPMPDDTVKKANDIFRNRWRTLLSVDDMVADIVDTLNRSGELANTYIFFSSDNGYHLGQFGLPYDKRQMYDFDIRVPLMVRGPGIKPGSVSKEVVLNIDFAPTFVDIVDQSVLPNVDGVTMAPILHQSNGTRVLRTEFLVEHQGEYGRTVGGCPQYTNQSMANCDAHCVCEDSKNNTYGCIVQVENKQTMKYCEFQDTENFIEVYDTTADPHELKNLAGSIDPKVISDFGRKLQFLATCAGPECNSVPKGGWYDGG